MELQAPESLSELAPTDFDREDGDPGSLSIQNRVWRIEYQLRKVEQRLEKLEASKRHDTNGSSIRLDAKLVYFVIVGLISAVIGLATGKWFNIGGIP